MARWLTRVTWVPPSPVTIRPGASRAWANHSSIAAMASASGSGASPDNRRLRPRRGGGGGGEDKVLKALARGQRHRGECQDPAAEGERGRRRPRPGGAGRGL